MFEAPITRSLFFYNSSNGVGTTKGNMCSSSKKSSTSSSNVPKTATGSSSSSSSNSMSGGSRDNTTGIAQKQQSSRKHHAQVVLRRQSSSFAQAGAELSCGTVLSCAVVAFSLYLPFALAPRAASETYHYAFYDYDADISHFDNDPWTYGSDYLLALAMIILARRISMRHSASRIHAFRSRGLLTCYMLSVLAGGFAHQAFTTTESLNTGSFRFLWTLCVGTVTAASGFMGTIGTELVEKDRELLTSSPLRQVLPLLPCWFWTGFAVFSTAVAIGGGLSYQRPACDIFIAGITQFPSTFYLMCIFVWGLPTAPIPKWARAMGCVGFILNAPLLPLYPLLVQYTNLQGSAVNTILHTWLLVAWGLQGIALRRVGLALVQAAEPPRTAVPVKPAKQSSTALTNNNNIRPE